MYVSQAFPQILEDIEGIAFVFQSRQGIMGGNHWILVNLGRVESG